MKIVTQHREKLSPWALLVLALICLPGCKDSESGSDVPGLPAAAEHEGFWRATSAIMAGTPFDDEVTRSITVKIADDRYETMVGSEVDRGDCIVDQGHAPKRMTITGTDGPNNGMTYLAVYEMVDGDTLRICYDLSGKNYPDTFDATKENGYYTATYLREPTQPTK